MFEAGNCFLVETNNREDGTIISHLFVIVDVCSNDRIILVNIDKIEGKKKYDKTIVLRTGEGHAFVIQDSFVNYQRAYVTTPDQLNKLIIEKKAKHKGVFDSGILKRVCSGLLKSRFTKEEVREAYQEHLYKEINNK